MITKLKYLTGWFTLAVISPTHRTYTFDVLQYDINSTTDLVTVNALPGPIALNTIPVAHSAIVNM